MLEIKNKDEKEKLLSQLREKDAIIKSLCRQIAKLNKEFNLPAASLPVDLEEDDKPKKKMKKEKKSTEVKPKEDLCPNCNTGKLVIIDLGIKILETCSIKCGHRKTTKNG